MALTFAHSWYLSISLGQMATMRVEGKADLVRRDKAIEFRVNELASYDVLDTYYPELGEDGAPMPEYELSVPISCNDEEVGSILEELAADDEVGEADVVGWDVSSVEAVEPPASNVKCGQKTPPPGDVEMSQ